jgi:uncharacterized protein HemX
MPEPLSIVLVLAALVLGAVLYLVVIRRRGRARHRAHADEWDRATSQARAIERLRHLEEADHQQPGKGTR